MHALSGRHKGRRRRRLRRRPSRLSLFFVVVVLPTRSEPLFCATLYFTQSIEESPFVSLTWSLLRYTYIHKYICIYLKGLCVHQTSSLKFAQYDTLNYTTPLKD